MPNVDMFFLKIDFGGNFLHEMSNKKIDDHYIYSKIQMFQNLGIGYHSYYLTTSFNGRSADVSG